MVFRKMHCLRLPTLFPTMLLALGIAASGHVFGDVPVSISVRTAKGDAVADAVVALIPLDLPAPEASGAAGSSREIVQKGEQFIPYVTVVQAGTRVAFPNRDSVQHHVYSLSKAKKFELPLYDPGRSESLMFDVSGTVTLGCNIHDWMIAYVIVVPTPYFAKTSADGTASVSAPSGRYRVELLHPRLSKAIEQEILLEEGKAATRAYTIALKPDRRIRRGSDAKSGGYP